MGENASTGITFAPLKSSTFERAGIRLAQHEKSVSGIDLGDGALGADSAPQSEAMIDRMIPLWHWMSASASWRRALSGWGNWGGQVENVTSNPSLSRNPPATETWTGV